MSGNNPIIRSIARGWRKLVSRPLYLGMFLVPVFSAIFFLSLLSEGLPMRTPVALVDLDHSSMSRQVTRTLASSQLLSITDTPESFHEAMAMVRRGDIFGFFLIPADFQKQTLAGNKPTLSLYSNMTYFVPGTLSFKGFKTIAVATSGGVAMSKLQATGIVTNETITDLLQPVNVQTQALHNPWTNYSIYLSNSFIPGVIALMVLLLTAYTVCDEIKWGSSVEWLRCADGSMVVALFGKLLPQAVIWIIIGVFCQSLLYGYSHFPLNNHLGHMIAAMVLLVVGTQAFSLAICEALPNLRLALSVNSLVGILSFSVTGFSFPVQSMYGAIGVFSYLIPLRWYFLIYIDQALNGIPIFYSRWYYVAVIIIMLVPFIGLKRLRGRCLNPVYVK